MNLEFSSLSGLRSQAHFLDFYQQVFFLSSHQHGHFWNLITQSYVWFLAHHRRSVLGNREQFSLYIYWPVPSPVAAVLLHIWNLPNEMTLKQSCCSERCCSRSGRHSPVAAVLVQIWHILNFRQDSSWFSSAPVSSGLRSQAHFLYFISKFFFSGLINLAISEIWLPSSAYDFTTREAQFFDTEQYSPCVAVDPYPVP